MSLPKFAVGMIFVIAMVVLWSVADAASLGTVLLRIILCAVLLQVGYFIYVLALVAVQSRKPLKVDARKLASSGEKRPAKKDLSIERPLSH